MPCGFAPWLPFSWAATRLRCPTWLSRPSSYFCNPGKVHDLQVNPDCGLKTRGIRENAPSISNTVNAARRQYPGKKHPVIIKERGCSKSLNRLKG
ncbi:MAG: hypothetical protein H5T98_04425 [Syntrophomonadaceae bacterium]|nr:hypothetical protein [Syntrophomonadaceae bacterium]